MSRPIIHLFALIVVLFTLLIVFTTRWTVLEARTLNNSPLNHRTLIDALKVKRGRILADDGTVLAQSVANPDGTYSRTYPTGSEFAQAVGYSVLLQGQWAGLESQYRDQLKGTPTGINSIFGSLGGSKQVGNDVYTSLDPKAQQVAIGQLAGQVGSVVALDPRTGQILVMYSNPTYDDNTPSAGTQFNRALEAQRPPGSTFKVVTATAAIDSRKYTPDSAINGNSPKTISGVPLYNDNNQPWGDVSLTTALTYSINTVFAQVAESLGIGTMTSYMKRFGFYSKPPLDYPSGAMSTSKPPYPAGSPGEDIGRIAIGQGGLQVTPMQMAMVAAAVANGGKLMKPHFATKAVNPDGQTVQTIAPALYNQVMMPSTAQQLTQMMKKVVEEGTGTAANLGGVGVTVAGKTGTASVGANGSGLTEPWFIGFAPAESPRVTVAVTIEQTQGQFGGTVAAPIAKAVIQTLLAEGR